MSMHIHSSRRMFLASAAMVTLTALVAATLPRSAHAYDENSSSSINVDTNGLALKGYDPVSYRSATGPVKGNASFSEKYDDATY